MTAKLRRDTSAAIGVGVAACAACCAGPIIGVIGAIGLGTVVGVVLFGFAGVAIAAIGLAALVHRRRRASTAHASADVEVPIEMRDRAVGAVDDFISHP